MKVSEGSAGTDESITTNDTHLQTCILSNHTVIHHGCHKHGGTEGEERTIPDHREHYLAILRNVDIVPDDAVFNDHSSVDGNIVSDDGGTVYDGMWIDDTVATNGY